MRKFKIVNADKFNGQAEIVYNDRGTLCIIDCSDTDMNEQTVDHFKKSVPANIGKLQEAFKHPTVIADVGFEVTFERFYKDYPLKRNRYKAEKQWAKLTDTERIIAWHSLSSYKKYLSRQSWQSPMLADSYLSRREFETEWHKIQK